MENLSYLESLILLLIGLLFFRDEMMDWLKQKLGFKSRTRGATKEQVDELAEYVNHRQTEIMAEQTRILAGIDNKTDKIIAKHDEWERHGVPLKSKL